MPAGSPLFAPLILPCGVTLKNRIVKSAMSDSLGDGQGNPTPVQIRLYERWAMGGSAVAIIGEVQGDPRAAEKPGNLVLGPLSDNIRLRELAVRGSANDTHLWAQLGHAGAMTHPPIGDAKGPSALDLPGLSCVALSADEIDALPGQFARTAAHAKSIGFTGVQVHAAHGFLLSQFLSPLFNKRSDQYGGSLTNRMRLLFEVMDAVRIAVGPNFPIALKRNATDQLKGGLVEDEALDVVGALDATSIDLIDISGGTYFPGAKSVSDRAASGPYFIDFASTARTKTRKHLMITGGFKTAEQATRAVASGAADVVGLARALVLAPDLPHQWRQGGEDIAFPRFMATPEGGVTAWYTQQLRRIGQDQPIAHGADLIAELEAYNRRDQQRIAPWNAHFGWPASGQSG